MPFPITYASLFADLRSHLIANAPSETAEITKSIKQFFREEFDSSHKVLCSHAKGCEFLTDVLVTSFNPKSVVQKGTLQLLPTNIDVFLAAESELGGEGASSPYGVMKNVVEDYLKLLVVRCQYRVMVFTSLPFSGEIDHVQKRVETLRELYVRSSSITSGVLLVHLSGSQPVSSQVRASVNATSIRGFEVSIDGSSVNEVRVSGANDEVSA